MVRGRALLPLILLLSTSFPLAHAAVPTATPVEAQGPDAEGGFTLLYDVESDSAREVVATLLVIRDDGAATTDATRALGMRSLGVGTTRLALPFLPGEGAGRYEVTLALDGDPTGATLSFDVGDAAATRTVTFQVEDEPTLLALLNDDVNADGKTKSPGEALVTRARLTDANGAADVDGVRWRVERGARVVADGDAAWSPGNGTSADVEVRFDRAPFAAGNYTMRLVARRDGEDLASVTRTFTIREVAPTFVSGALANVTPDEPQEQTARVVLADRNGDLSALPEVRVYRGSTRAEPAGLEATLGEPSREEDVAGASRVAIPLTLRVPSNATSGAYRVSLYHDGALLGSLPFHVLALPTLREVRAATEAGDLVLTLNGTGDGLALVSVSDAAGVAARASEPFRNGSATLRLPPLRQGTTYTWQVDLLARAEGPALATRVGDWSAPLDGPPLQLTPLHVRARLPAAWAIAAEWPVEEVDATWRFTRWDGAVESRLSGEVQEGRARVTGPSDLPAGRYTAHLRLEWANGSASETSWSFDLGPWVELALGEPVVDGRVATIAVTNAGAVAITKLVVESQGANVTLRLGDQTLSPDPAGSRALFRGVDLPSGGTGELVVRLPEGTMRSGRHDVHVRVLAKVAIG